eukprot:m51a1_g814 putative zinc finger rad18 domain-containing protein c1orf124 homolog (261) ;mRNA; r:685964-686895
MADDADFLLALALQQEEIERSQASPSPASPPGVASDAAAPPFEVVPGEEEEEGDPTPDVHALMAYYDQALFGGAVMGGGAELSWSTRMTLCAGTCAYHPRSRACVIRLSEALLKFRPASDTRNTLIHEMIHAYLFITGNRRDHDDHGPEFLRWMELANRRLGSSVTVYHTFHDEVDHYRQHWWQCDGPCRTRPPFYGMVRRAQNRPPGPNDPWWARHQSTCGGVFVKVKSPPEKKRRRSEGDAGPERKSKRSRTSEAACC